MLAVSCAHAAAEQHQTKVFGVISCRTSGQTFIAEHKTVPSAGATGVKHTVTRNIMFSACQPESHMNVISALQCVARVCYTIQRSQSRYHVMAN